MSIDPRALSHQKGTVVTVGVGTPGSGEGADGDLTLRKVAQGLVLFIKYENRWYDVNSLKNLEGQGTSGGIWDEI